MKKIRHTKNELKKQKDDLKRFTRYLPTLILKKQQLQIEITKILHAVDALEAEIKKFRESLHKWVDVFAEKIKIENIIAIETVKTSSGNIAGTDIPIFEEVSFTEKDYDFVKIPLWVDDGIEAIKKFITFKAEIVVLKKQFELIRRELRTTTQRVNLFEKIKIPTATDNIRRIRIFLGDMQTAAVVTGKIAKNKIKRKEELILQS